MTNCLLARLNDAASTIESSAFSWLSVRKTTRFAKSCIRRKVFVH